MGFSTQTTDKVPVDVKAEKLVIDKNLDKILEKIDQVTKPKENTNEMDFENCNIQLKPKHINMNTPSARKRAAYNFIEQTMSSDVSPHSNNVAKEPNINEKDSRETNKPIKDTPNDKKPTEYESRRKKPVSSLIGEVDNTANKLEQENFQKRQHSFGVNKDLETHKGTNFNQYKHGGDGVIYDSRRQSKICTNLVSKMNHDKDGLYQFNK